MGAPFKYKAGDLVRGIEFIQYAGRQGNNTLGEFKCPLCTKYFIAAIGNVRAGTTSSCGCYRSISKTKHGHAKTGEQSYQYKTWAAIIGRCENPDNAAYPGYGGRGIKVCERWRHSFENFLHDIGERPTPKHSLDRWPNNDGDYAPDNFRWATQKEQCRNTRKTLHVEYDGQTKPLRQLCEELNLDFRAVWHRIKIEKLSVKEAVEKPFRVLPKGRRNTLIVNYKGEHKQLKEWCKLFSLDYITMRWAIFKKKMTVEEAFNYKKTDYIGSNNFISHSFGHIKVA